MRARPTRTRIALAAALLAGLPTAAYIAAPAAAVTTAAAPGADLAGFNTSAVGAAAQIELLLPGLVPLGDVTKGNFVQASVPYASSTASTGPQNNGLASPAWPGDSAATAGNALQTFEPSLPQAIVNLLDDPIVARSAFPGQVSAQPSATYNPSGPAGIGTSTTTSTAGGSTSSSVVNDLSPLGSAKATGTSLLEIGSAISNTSSTVAAASVSANASTHIGKVTIAGLVTINGVDSNATAGSNGKTGSKDTNLKIGSVTVAGLAASIGPNGITLNKSGLLGQLGVIGIANKALASLNKTGISIKTIAPTSKVKGKTATATSGAVQIAFKDANLPDIGKLLPQAPVPLPTSVGFTIDLGLSQASAAATLSPAFENPPAPKVTSPPATTPAGPTQTGTGPTGGSLPSEPSGPVSSSAPVQAATPVIAQQKAATAFGLPVRTAWVVISFLLALLLAGLLLSYANWQLLRGRTP
jgi:hypothetical protein